MRERKPSDRNRPDGRRALLVYLRQELIKRLKIAALDENRPAYELTEEAIAEWLVRRRGRKRRG
jgi:hypothetical protein